jgi:hypothetical protein
VILMTSRALAARAESPEDYAEGLVVDKLRRYVAWESLEHEIIREQAALMA